MLQTTRTETLVSPGTLIPETEWKRRFIEHFASWLTDSGNFINAAYVWSAQEALNEAQKEYRLKGSDYRLELFGHDPEGAADDAILYDAEEPCIL